VLDRQHRTIETIIVSGVAAIAAFRPGNEPPPMLAPILDRRETLRGHQDGATSLALPANHPPVLDYLAAPLASPAHVYGWIFLAGNEGRAFSEEDEQLLMALGGQAGRIFENGYFFALAQRRAEALEQEVAQRLEVEAELRAERDRLATAEERIRFALESAEVGIWDRDYRTGVVRWSEILEKQFGLAPGSFAGTFEAFVGHVHPEDRASMLASVQQATESGEDFWLQHRTIWPDGQVRSLSTRGRILLDADRRPARAVGVVLDITDRRALEEQYQQAQKMEAIGRLAGGVAHDFNNLLTSILGYCELLTADLDGDDPRRADIAQIAHAGTTAATLTRQLLAFSRKQIIEPRVLDLNAVVAAMRSLIERLIGEDIRVVVSLSSQPLLIRADRGQIEQTIMNLAVNARDAMPNGGILTIDTMAVELDADYASKHFATTPGSYVVLNVTDNGTGMSAAVQERLFEPFFTTKEVGKGTGLGLATVHGIVSRCGGSIGVYSELDRGTTFKVYLPRVEGVSPDAEEEPRPAFAAPPARRTVLVVEDSDAVRELTRRLLERIGYTALVAADADEARDQLARGTPIDVLLTDVVMPGASGPELTDSLLAMRPSLKVIYMSGYTEEAIVQHGMLKPGLAFLHKPFNSGSLARKLLEVLGR
jgi:PAS domain S-box-containing protein